MKQNKLFLITLLLLLVTMVAGCGTTAANQTSASSTATGDVFQKIVTLGFLVDWGVLGQSIDPTEGFIRFLLLILLFSVLFKLAELLKLGKNVAIVIALVISLMTVIFIPGTIILAAATTYGTVFSLIFLSLPIALCFAVYFLLKEHPWLKAAVMGLLLLLLWQMDSHMQSFTIGASEYYTAIINTVIGWMDIVFWIIVAFFIISLVQAFASLATGASGAEMNLKETARNIYNFAKRGGRRKKTRLMNEYIEEEKELKLLDEAAAAREEALDAISVIDRTHEIHDAAQRSRLANAVKLVKGKLDEAKREFRRVKGRTWRQERGFDKLVKEFKDKDKDVGNLAVLEKNILAKHNEAINALNAVLAAFEPALSGLSVIERLTAFPAVVAMTTPTPAAHPPLQPHINKIKKALTDLNLEAVEKAQKEALKEVEGIIIEARELMKWK